MRLLRVQVPNFRALKDVDISFEPDFVPNIFPIGSQNGGGKSTLLQLIFILLHCSGNRQRTKYLKNLLNHFDFTLYYDNQMCTIANLALELDKEIYEINFLYYSSDCPDLDSVIDDDQTTVILYKDREDIFDNWVFCKIQRLDENNFAHPLSNNSCYQILENLSEKIFLLVPGSQIFLFSGREHNRNLLRGLGFMDASPNDTALDLPGLFNYNFLAVDLLLRIFKQARDFDFQNAVDTGKYGNSYQDLLDELNLLLGNKIVNIVSSALDEVTFYKTEKGQRITIHPEDLSRGEMQRLSLYVWLKKSQIQDAVILIDEVETALHPDWQYQIVSDLATWGPTNQYLLATHSYELCEALTPAHVKQIPPNLIQKTPVSL